MRSHFVRHDEKWENHFCLCLFHQGTKDVVRPLFGLEQLPQRTIGSLVGNPDNLQPQFLGYQDTLTQNHSVERIRISNSYKQTVSYHEMVLDIFYNSY